jgi:hypothetical protein
MVDLIGRDRPVHAGAPDLPEKVPSRWWAALMIRERRGAWQACRVRFTAHGRRTRKTAAQ